MSAERGAPWHASALIAAVVASTLIAGIVTGDPRITLAPVGLTVLAWALLAAPLHRIALVVFFVAIVADNPAEHPAEGHWASPLQPLGVLLYDNLNNITGIRSLRFSGMDLLLAVLVLVVVVRGPNADAIPAPRALHRCLGVAWLAVIWLEAWGLLRGGDFKASLWQIRPLFWAPVVAYIFSASLRGPRDHAAIGAAVVSAAILKAALGAYYYLVVCRPLGYQPAYATTHSDTVLFVGAMTIAVAIGIERQTPRAVLGAAITIAAAGLGVIVNGRRLAYVSLLGSLVTMYALLPRSGPRRTINRALAAVTPAAAAYLALGWSSGSAIFGPARKIASLFSKTDRSSGMRDIEDYNLILTWKKHLILGSGFGHEYDEISRADSIRDIFPLYRYIGHNSILWLASVGGLVGFTAFWLLLVVTAFFAARSYRFATAPLDRAAALGALSMAGIVAVQAYGDMGLTSWTAIFLLAASLVVAAKCAVAVGAFPWPRDLAHDAAPRAALAPSKGT
jgi:hypothetical protein